MYYKNVGMMLIVLAVLMGVYYIGGLLKVGNYVGIYPDVAYLYTMASTLACILVSSTFFFISFAILVE